MSQANATPAASGRILRVVRFSRQTRAVLQVEGEHLTDDEADALANRLRAEHRADEDAFGFAVQTMPLAEQVTPTEPFPSYSTGVTAGERKRVLALVPTTAGSGLLRADVETGAGVYRLLVERSTAFAVHNEPGKEREPWSSAQVAEVRVAVPFGCAPLPAYHLDLTGHFDRAPHFGDLTPAVDDAVGRIHAHAAAEVKRRAQEALEQSFDFPVTRPTGGPSGDGAATAEPEVSEDRPEADCSEAERERPEAERRVFTPQQRLAVQFEGEGFDRDGRLAFASGELGRVVGSFNELSVGECAALWSAYNTPAGRATLANLNRRKAA